LEEHEQRENDHACEGAQNFEDPFDEGVAAFVESARDTGDSGDEYRSDFLGANFLDQHGGGDVGDDHGHVEPGGGCDCAVTEAALGSKG